MKRAIIGAVILFAFSTTAEAQQGRWATKNDATAKSMIDMERQWAEAGCNHLPGVEKFLADDFQGTAPDGSRYDKTGALQNDKGLTERECHLDDAKVRFFGDAVALVYGSERALRKPENGPESQRCLVWTDTWLKRDGKWKIVAAQDTAIPCK